MNLEKNSHNGTLTALLLTGALFSSGCVAEADHQKADKGPQQSTDIGIIPQDSANPDTSASKEVSAICDLQHDLITGFLGLNTALQQCKSCHVPGKYGEGAWVWYDGDNPQMLQTAFNKFFLLAARTTPEGDPYIVFFPQKETEKILPDGSTQSHPGGKQAFDDYMTGKLTAFHESVRKYITENTDSAAMDAGSSGADVSDASDKITPPKVNTDCKDNELNPTEEEFFDGLEILDHNGIFIKFLRNISGGKLPEIAPNITSRDQLKQYLRQETNKRGFYDWLKWNLNDLTLTRFYSSGNDALNFMGKSYNVNWEQFDNQEVADSTQNLLAYIVYNNRSIKEFLTANYLVLPGKKPPGNNPDENWMARMTTIVPATPLAGLFSDLLWLAQHPSTDTNLNRHRAWHLLAEYFDLNVLDIGSQNVEAPANTPFPTLTFGPCLTCHADTPLDAAAAALMNWQKGFYEYIASLPPGFLVIVLNGEKVPNDAVNRLQQFMQLITKDPLIDKNSPDYNPDREFPFATSIAKLAFRMLTQREPTKKPRPSEMRFKSKMRHYSVERKFFKEMAQYLIDKNYNFRELIIEMATSKWFAANGRLAKPPAKMDEDRKVELEGVGPGMITPEILVLRLRQLFGDEIYKSGIDKLIMENFATNLGGINSKDIKTRQRDPNAAYELVINFFGYDLGKLIINELAKPAAQRHLLRDLDFGPGELEAPLYPGTRKPIPGNEEKWRNCICRIIRFTHGRYYDPDSQEGKDAYNEWLKIWLKFFEDNGDGKIADTHQTNDFPKEDHYGLARSIEAYIAKRVSSIDFNLQ